MRFSLPFKGRAPRPSVSYAKLAKKRRNGGQKAWELANGLFKEGKVGYLWERGRTSEIITLCVDTALEYGDLNLVSETMIWISLRNILRGANDST